MEPDPTKPYRMRTVFRLFATHVDRFGGTLAIACGLGWLVFAVPLLFDVINWAGTVTPWHCMAGAIVLVTLWSATRGAA